MKKEGQNLRFKDLYISITITIVIYRYIDIEIYN